MQDVSPGPDSAATTLARVTSEAVPRRRRGRRALRVLAWVVGSLLALALVAVIAFSVSPWPGALLIRASFDRGGRETNEVLAGYVPDGVAVTRDVVYRTGDPDGMLDVYYPEGTTSDLPTIVWVHGGGWLAGDKEGLEPWARILAGRGFTVVAVDYTLAPSAHYPYQLQQVLDAIDVVRTGAAPHVDADNLFLAGDSAGASLVAQAATVMTTPAYADEIGVTTPAPPDAVAGLILHCGPYDLRIAEKADGLMGWAVSTIGWAYSGERHFLDDPLASTISLVDHAYPGFPPVFISGGNGDPLTTTAKTYADRLEAEGNAVDRLFFPDDQTPELGHEYQFDLRLDAAREALELSVAFVHEHATR